MRNVADLRLKLEELLSKPELIKEVGERGRAYIEKHFNWDLVVEKTEKLYKGLLTKN